MILEDQGIPFEKLEAIIVDIAYEIKRDMRKSMWDQNNKIWQLNQKHYRICKELVLKHERFLLAKENRF